MDRLIPKIDTYHLIIFYYVAKERSITAAAKKLYLSQPTVTNHIRSLEESIQLKLIRTDSNKLTLTCMGEGLYHYAEEILHTALSADRFTEIIKDSNINIGVCSLFVQVMSKIINDISEQQGMPARISVRFGEPLNLVKEVVESKLDLALLPNLDDGSAKLHHIKIADGIKIVFYASPSHPIFRKRSIKWVDIGNYPLVIGAEPSSIKKMVTNKLISEGLKTPPKYYLTGYDVEFCKNIVRNGNFISLALEEDVEEETKMGTLKCLTLPDDIQLNINIVARKTLLATALAQQFISYAKVAFSELEVLSGRDRKAAETQTIPNN